MVHPVPWSSKVPYRRSTATRVDDPFDALHNADPTGSPSLTHEHWRTREHSIMSTTNQAHITPTRTMQRLRLVALPAVALAGLLLLTVLPSPMSTLEPINVAGVGTATESPVPMQADSRLALWDPVEYRLASGVDATGGDRPVWRFETATAEDVSAHARRFSERDPLLLSTGPDLSVSYTTGGLYAASNGHFSWSNVEMQGSVEMRDRYATPSCATAGTEASTTPDDATVSTSPSNQMVCDSTTTRSIDLPDDETAIDLVRVYLPGAELTIVNRSEWSVSVAATYRIGEYLLEGNGFAEVNDLGVLWVSGMFTNLEMVNKYPTISAAKALSRLNTPMGFDPAVVRIDSSVAPPAVTASEPAAVFTPDPTVPEQGDQLPDHANPASQFCVDNGGTLEPSVTPAGESARCVLPDGRDMDEWEFYRAMNSSPPRVVELVGVSTGYTTLWDNAGRVWVVPAWVYAATDGSTYTAVALTDEHYNTVSVQDATDDSMSIPEPDPGSSTATPGPTPAFDVSALTGLSVEAATEVAAASGFVVRVISRDGESLPATKDYRVDRIGLAVEADKVVSASLG